MREALGARSRRLPSSTPLPKSTDWQLVDLTMSVRWGKADLPVGRVEVRKWSPALPTLSWRHRLWRGDRDARLLARHHEYELPQVDHCWHARKRCGANPHAETGAEGIKSPRVHARGATT